VVCAVAVILLTVAAGPASAHVEVYDGQGPVQGDDGVVQVTVPVEKDDANTVGLTLKVPAGVGLTEASVLPLPGWSATVQTVDGGEQVSQIVWRADDQKHGGLVPGQFGIFTFSAGPWPADRDSVAIPATQTYSDGTVVQWNQIALDAKAEPEHPAPIVQLRSEQADHEAAVAERATATSSAGGSAAGTESGTSAKDVVQWALLVLAVILSGTAAAVSISTRRRDRPGAGLPA
jgi:uncharacterized protein YcnI